MEPGPAVKVSMACCVHKAGGMQNYRESARKGKCGDLNKVYLMQRARTGDGTWEMQPLFSETYLQLCHDLVTSNLLLQFSFPQFNHWVQ